MTASLSTPAFADRQTPGLVAALTAILFIAGCGGEPPPRLVPVTGKVMMDGKPLTAGSVSFHPDAGNSYQKDSPSSLLQVDGSFKMATYPFGEGVAPGKYKVTVSAELANRVSKPQFGRVDKTPWSIEVPESGLADHIFEVK
jgi:hypothetical protein